MPFLLSAALLLWENISFFSIVQLKSASIYVYNVNNASSENKLIQCHDRAYIYLLQYPVNPIALTKEFDCEQFLKNPISLQFLLKAVNTHNGILPLFSRIVRFDESTSASSFSWINLISPPLPIRDFTANNHTKKGEEERNYDEDQALFHFQYDRSSWFMGVEGNEYGSLIISDINYLSFRHIQKQQHTGQLVQLSHLDLISLEARLLHYESFATYFSTDNFTESSVGRNNLFSNDSNIAISRNSNTSGNDDKNTTNYNQRQNKKCNQKRHRKHHPGACWSLAVCRSMSSALSTRISRYSPSSLYGYYRRAIPFMVHTYM
jgi:hypothetical protein